MNKPTRIEKGRQPQPDEKQGDEIEHDNEDAEHIRSGSQTAQDRDHTIRGGDNHTGPMKEFPT
jgi:hypothetical protein